MTDPTSDRSELLIGTTVARHRPWLSDGTWVAHESLPAVARLAARMTHSGLWEISAAGIVRSDPTHPDLVGMMAVVAERAAPSPPPEPIELDGWPALEVNLIGRRWVFDRSLVAGLTDGIDPIEWRLAVERFAMLVAFDRKGRARVAVASLEL